MYIDLDDDDDDHDNNVDAGERKQNLNRRENLSMLGTLIYEQQLSTRQVGEVTSGKTC